MSIPVTLQHYLDRCGVKYDVLTHRYSGNSLKTAEEAGVSGENIAKSVILEDDRGYLMAVVPATHHVELGLLGRQLNRHLGLATEKELTQLFSDCDPGVGYLFLKEIELCLTHFNALNERNLRKKFVPSGLIG